MTPQSESNFLLVNETVTLRGRTLRSRVYLPAHQPGLADGGLPGDRYIAYHRERARAGLGMQITGATPVIWSEVWADGLTLVNVDERIVPGYRRLAAAVHAEGGVMLAQLAHVGAMETAGDAILSASWTRSEITQRTARAASIDELAEVAERFSQAATRCRIGDLDGVEVTMAHGMLLASFLSPLMNRRHDRYGGDLDGRTLFPREVLHAVRTAIGPTSILGIRIPGDELTEGGIMPDEAAAIAERLVRTGDVDYVSVTAGNNTRKLSRVDHWPPTPARPGAFRHLSRRVKDVVSVPVATVGRVTTLALAEDILRAGDADLVGMVRAHVADPELLPRSRAGKPGTVRPCIGANVCINSLLEHRPLTCLANPDVGWPGQSPPRDWGHGRAAIVVGAGPAGMEAARRLGIGGWRCTVIDRAERVGGQMAVWSETPSRMEFARLVTWWESECTLLGVSIELREEARAATILAREPDLVIVATGSAPVLRPVGQTGHGVVQLGPYDPPRQGGHVVVQDEMGGVMGMLTAERLSLSASQVTLVTSLMYPGEGDGITTVYPLLRDIAARGVRVIDRARIVSIDERRVHLAGVFGEARPPLDDVDALVGVIGTISRADLVAPIHAAGVEVIAIGDAHLPRDVTASVAHAARAMDRLATESLNRAGAALRGPLVDVA